ncbi:MAG TPA: hypothetical protein VN454_02470 [Candidatus Angelobacter sp.]|nr:hypothetical protein [Candidatus Angelobacter sp.]
MFFARIAGLSIAVFLASLLPVGAQESSQTGPEPSREVIAKLLEQLKAQDARLKELEGQVAALKAAQPAAAPVPAVQPETQPATVQEPPPEPEMHEHTMQLPGVGPVLKIRGFADINLGFGPVANPLIFPLPAPVHDTVQLGEFDLFLSSRLSRKLSFLGEIVYGSDATNSWDIDIERLQITLKANRYFEISAGRFHSSIGYYNTSFHHGTWFQTATGRPFMYYFEDSGGLLPVHQVGVTSTGLVPRTERLQLHWVAEFGNGRSADPAKAQVQDFLSERDHKSLNLAAYIKPEWAPGVQIGGSYFRDRLLPSGLANVTQEIGSVYLVYTNGTWELLNEAVLIHNKMDGAAKGFNSPLSYAQISRKFGVYRPYFRFQYVNVPNNDPVNIFTGRYEGPSVGLRMDFTEYAALKAQFNRIYQRAIQPQNGLDLQVSFTF